MPKAITATVTKWGNSLALRIPSALARQIDVREGRSVDLKVRGDSLVVTPVSAPHYDLEELVKGITEENRHEETDWGPAVGPEFR
jgi:antitoxin MazE